MTRFRVAMDIGGTFTDFVLHDLETGEVRIHKVLTTPQDRAVGVMAGLADLIEEVSDLGFCVHGTTAGLNALLERKGAHIALLTTEGFRDVIFIGRGNRPEMYNIRYRKPQPLLERCHVFEVPERIRADGSVERSLAVRDLEPLLARLQDGRYEAVAVSLLHAYANPAHEQMMRELLEARLPGVHVSLSSEVAAEWREYERTSTTVIDAYVAPIINRYLGSLEERLQGERGLKTPIYIMRSNGGVMTSRVARRRSVQTLLSGPVGGAVGAGALSAQAEEPNLVCVDMGGTSFDVTLVLGGETDLANEVSLEGFPVLTPMVNLHTIGAGGGSIAWIQAGGLRVGPESAGSQPGPACYRMGGTQPTVTDANVVLGRIDPDRFLGGRMHLDVEAARRAVELVAAPLGLSVEAAAEGIVRVANAKMADAIRRLTIHKGLDPRLFALVAFGGAGPVHAAFLAEELGIQRVLIPQAPGAFSALGMLQAPIRHDGVRTFYRQVAEVDHGEMARLFRSVRAEVEDVLAEQGAADAEYQQWLDLRYVGQEYSIRVRLEGDAAHKQTLARAAGGFHELHEQVYGHSNPRGELEVVNVRITAVSGIRSSDSGLHRDPLVPPADQTSRKRQVVFGGQALESHVYARSELESGRVVSGPAVIEELSTTLVVPPGFAVRASGNGALLMERTGKAAGPAEARVGVRA